MVRLPLKVEGLHNLRIAWCEQSGIVEDRSALLSALSARSIDYYRFNWKIGLNDPSSNVAHTTKSSVSWSKGRELLYFSASKYSYDYYIFVDDDIVFDRPYEDAISEILETLFKYRPSVLTVRSNSWQERLVRDKKEAVVAVFVVDLQFQCLSSSVAAFSFPARFDGGWGTLWYPMIFFNRSPGYVISIRSILLLNKRQNESKNYGGIENDNADNIWKRSRHFMSLHAKVLSFLLGHRRTIVYLNALYSCLVEPRTYFYRD